MPYIKKDNGRREALNDGRPALIAGELNYQIFYYVKHQIEDGKPIDVLIIKDFVDQFLEQGKKNYQRYNDMTGCLVRCYKELQRRLDLDITELLYVLEEYDNEIAKYEDIKIKENGEVE